jgi:hypothetical protein
MSTRNIHFNGMVVSDISYQGDNAEIRFDYAIIVKNMDAAQEDTRWYGSGLIIIEELFEQTTDLPTLPATLTSADIRDNQMIYRDEIAIPFAIHGNVGLQLRFTDWSQLVKISGEKMSLELSGQEKYIEHIKAG